MQKWLAGAFALIGLLALAFLLSPWPSVLVVRTIFDQGAAAASARLAPHVPATVTTQTVGYDPRDPRALLDIHRPSRVRADAPVILWIHGGGFVSGRRGDISNYARLLAGRGFIVLNVDYTIAPEARYPTPVRQVNQALAFVAGHGAALGIGSRRVVLAGDSAGAQIAAQTAAVITNSGYARLVGVEPGLPADRLAGTLLYCGIYDVAALGSGGGVIGWFVQSAGWAYSGRRDWRNDRLFQTLSVAPHVTSQFPPTFISAGNADPLEPQSVAMARALRSAGVDVEELFFPADYRPPLGHEYQFDIDSAAGQLALKRSVDWLASL